MKCKRCRGRRWVWVTGGTPDELIQDICTACEGQQ